MDITERITNVALREKVRATLTHEGSEAVMVVVLDREAGIPGETAGLFVSCNEGAETLHMGEAFMDGFLQFLAEAHESAVEMKGCVN